MESLIPLVHRLQTILASVQDATLNLPQIVAIGSQSSGKSSCIEQLIGRDFLPKGAGIVTRRPIVLRLSHTSEAELNRNSENGIPTTEFCEFLHLPKHYYTNYNDVRDEIARETERVAGKNNDICKEPIYLSIHSKDMLNLTLVDLPGLTKIPVGDQPTDIEYQVRNLVLSFIRNPNCIILAISAGNVDIANSESLKLAREVDPQCRRTLGVLTKIDLLESGTNILDVLLGKIYTLHYGFIPVINRSQKDILNGKSMEKVRETEDHYFTTHPVYASIASQCGSKYLSKSLNLVLRQCIREKLPDIRIRLNNLISIKQAELKKVGDLLPSVGLPKEMLILKLLTQYASNFNAAVDGTHLRPMSEISGGAKIFEIFENVFNHSLNQFNPCNELSTEEIKMTIRNSTGPRASLFIPEAAFDALIKPLIRRLLDPALNCVQLVYETLLKTTHDSAGSDLQRYPKLKERIVEGVSSLLGENLVPASQFIRSLVDIQCAYINTSHPDFIGGANAVNRIEKIYENENARRSSIERMRRQTQAPSNSGDPSGVIGLGSNGTQDRLFKFLINGRSSVVQDETESSKTREEYSHKNGNNLNDKFVAAGAESVSNGIYTPDKSKYYSQPQQNNNLSDKENFVHKNRTDEASTPSNTMDEVVTRSQNSIFGFGIPSLRTNVNKKNIVINPPQTFETSNIGSAFKSEEEKRGIGHITLKNKSQEDFKVELIRTLISSYFSIVKKVLVDTVPKAVMNFLVNQTKESIQNRLVQDLYRPELIDELSQEDAVITSQRKQCLRFLDVYRAALESIAEAAA